MFHSVFVLTTFQAEWIVVRSIMWQTRLLIHSALNIYMLQTVAAEQISLSET